MRLALGGWARYRACPSCNAPAGQPCLNLRTVAAGPVAVPHPGRPLIPPPPVPPVKPSRLGMIVYQIMLTQGLTRADVAALSPWSVEYTHRVLAESPRPMTHLQAVALLGLLGHQLQYRAVPINNPVRGEHPA